MESEKNVDQNLVVLPDNLPENYTYKTRGNVIEIKEVTSETEALDWVQQLCNTSLVTWKVANTYPHTKERGKLYAFKIQYRCHHNTRHRARTAKQNKNTNCPAKLNVKVRRSDNDDDWKCIVEFFKNHNHAIDNPAALRYRPINTETEKELIKLYYSGHTPTAAYMKYTTSKMDELGIDDILQCSDRHIFVTQDDVKNLWRKLKYKISDEQECASQDDEGVKIVQDCKISKRSPCAVAKSSWKKIPCSFSELNLDVVLSSGQTFRWKKRGNIWQGVLLSHAYFLMQDINGNLLYKVRGDRPFKRMRLSETEHSEDVFEEASHLPEEILKDFFQLDVNLTDLYSHWSSVDENFSKICGRFSGIRILRQDPVENLISFICAANNNIPRITSMVEKLCSIYGSEVIGPHTGSEPFYTFPTLSQLADDKVEGELRSQGFGYRAKYINQAAKYLTNNYPPRWLESLRKLTYTEAHTALRGLPGVGAKVADCVCLMSLDKPEAIPVDTHVWQVTVRDYLPKLNGTKSLTDRVYQEIGDFYREKFGAYAGWANTVLFVADLKQFKGKNSP